MPEILEQQAPIIEQPPPPPKDVGKLGSTSKTSSFAQKFHEEFAKLDTAKEPVEPKTEESSKPVEPESSKESVLEPSKPQETTTTTKHESPLDVVLEKGTKEPEKPETEGAEYDIVKQFEDIQVPKKEHWKRSNTVMREHIAKIRELEGKLATPAAPEEVVVHTKRIEELEQALADRETRLKAAGAEYSPDYQKLVGKYQGTADKIKNRMESFGGDGNSLLAALSLPYSKSRTDQIDAALSDLDAGKQGRIQSLIEELEGHGEEIAEFRKDLPARYEEMTAKQEQAFREQQINAIKQMETEYLKIAESIQDDVVTLREVPEDVTGAEEWNKGIRAARTEGLRILKPDGSDFNESGKIALQGAHYPYLMKMFLKEHADNKELRKSQKEYDQSGPDFKGGSKPKQAATKGPKGAKGYHEVYNAIKRGEMDDI